MKPTPKDLQAIKTLVDGVAMSRSRIINGRIVWAWRRLSKQQRQIVDAESTPGLLDATHLDRVLEARTIATPVRRKRRS